MPMISRFFFVAILFAVMATPARAQNCTFGIDLIDFGHVDILSGSEATGSTSLHISCSGLALNTVRVCASFGSGSGGLHPPLRRITGSSSFLNFQLYQNSGRTVPWGSNYLSGYGGPPTIDIPLGLGGSGSVNVPIFTRLMAAQQTAHAGSYSANFSSTDIMLDYGYTFIGIVGCDAIPLLTRHTTTTFTVLAQIDPNCRSTAHDINFGMHGFLLGNIDSAGEINVTCTMGTPYAVGLDGGNSGGTPTARRMRKGSENIIYGIFRDAARTQPWGASAGLMVSGSGTGTAVPLATYGRVPAQATPSPGQYTDTIIATITY